MDVESRVGVAAGSLLASFGLLGLTLAVEEGAVRLHREIPLVLAAALILTAGWQAFVLYRGQVASLSQEQSRAELLVAQLEQQRSAVDALADGLDVAIFICDASGSIQYANLRACEMFRFENPLGRSLLAVTLSYDLEQLVLKAGREREPATAELTFTYPEERVAIANAWTPDEPIERVFLSVFEITHIRRLERVRQDFVANVSHELRTPMTLIRAMAETLLDEASTEDELAQRYLRKIVGEVDRLSSITQDLLILSAAESNPVRKQVCDIAEVFRSTAAQLRQQAEEKNLVLSFEGPEHLLIEANAAQMTQVAMNLTENAIKYSQQGTVAVRVRDGDGVARIEVADTGIGIASEHLPRVFERFYRVDKARSRGTGGTGLGLSIVKHIVEAHGGAVSVESVLNQGSTFRVRLPVGDIGDPDDEV